VKTGWAQAASITAIRATACNASAARKAAAFGFRVAPPAKPALRPTDSPLRLADILSHPDPRGDQMMEYKENRGLMTPIARHRQQFGRVWPRCHNLPASDIVMNKK
jgi:hypothetical protein